MQRLLMLAIVMLWLGATSSSVNARGGGGCLECGSCILTPRGYVPVEQLKPGDAVVSFNGNSVMGAKVQAVFSVEPNDYCELVVGEHVLRLTSEHPVEIGNGVFRMAAFLHAGDNVCIHGEKTLENTAIQSVKHLPAKTVAYNLLVSPGGTYSANGIVVHNKGCFLPETLIRGVVSILRKNLIMRNV